MLFCALTKEVAMSKGWPEERRRKQAERCRQNKPWKNATGPKTKAGKARSSMNAFKHGGRTEIIKLTNAALQYNGKFLAALNAVLALNEIQLKKPKEKQRRINLKLGKGR